jgi:hypothetical protein
VTEQQEKKSNALLIVAAIFGVIVLLCGGATVGVVVWVRANADDLKAAGEELMVEAQEFAANSTDSQCLEEGFVRAAPCMDLDIKCNVRARLFTAFCLDVAEQTPGFCDGVPNPSSLIEFTKYTTTVCAERGLFGQQSCSQMLQELADHCVEDRRPPPPQ